MGPAGPGPSEVPRLKDLGEEVRFSPDRDWMAELVMVAKHTLVWLDQLSARYARSIERLDQVPEAGATVFVGAPAHKGGSGGPARVIATF